MPYTAHNRSSIAIVMRDRLSQQTVESVHDFR